MSQSISKTELFEQAPIPQAVARLSVPCIMSSLVMILYNLADTWFVSLLNDPLENAAVTLAAPVILAFNAVNNLFGVGCASRMSRCLGLKEHEAVRKTSAFGFYLALASGLLFSLVSVVFRDGLLVLLGARQENIPATTAYLLWTVSFGAAPAILNVVMANMVRSEGSSLHASVGVMSGCLLNMILDPFFILPWGLNMGAAGAGLATFLSNCVATLYFLVLTAIKKGKTFLSFLPRDFRPDRATLRDVFGVGVPASIQNLLNVTGMTILNNLAADFGSAAVSAAGIAHKITLIPMYISMGISQGIMPLIGYNYAARNGKRLKSAVSFTIRIALVFELAVTALYFFFPGQIMGLFTKNAEIAAFGAPLTRGMCLAQPFLFLDFLAVAVFQACGMGRRSLLFAVLRKIVLEIPAQYILNHFWPLYGLGYAQVCAEIILAGAATVLLGRIFRESDRWQPGAENCTE